LPPEIYGQDWALVQLTEAVPIAETPSAENAVGGQRPPHRPATLETGSPPKVGQFVNICGCDMRLPIVFDSNKRVFSSDRAGYLYIGVDGSPGGSGSPVFNEQGNVVGIVDEQNLIRLFPNLSCHHPDGTNCDCYIEKDYAGDGSVGDYCQTVGAIVRFVATQK
jgi:hypothetical protein